MIYYLKGKVTAKNESRIILEVMDTGYEIFVARSLSDELVIAQEVKIYIYQQVREDGFALYGFGTAQELDFFRVLISVSGVGPKIGLNLISSLGLEKLVQAISRENLAVLTSVSGIGPKTAKLIVLELKEKVLQFMPSEGRGAALTVEEKLLEELRQALVSLGYSQKEAREALARIDPAFWRSNPTLENSLKAVLKFL